MKMMGRQMVVMVNATKLKRRKQRLVTFYIVYNPLIPNHKSAPDNLLNIFFDDMLTFPP
ncbi:hypothetical protein AB205_0092910 [Aquarana catesbeiana]|uniref:Uncharacterized protein n=1 Tax=Aquarana catesbeiana TaxID=8400 RepID=A0A2G9S4W9_AQUCT|nr:hypothetical protein AB205_0092910 [Aquarana catesbeiana]